MTSGALRTFRQAVLALFVIVAGAVLALPAERAGAAALFDTALRLDGDGDYASVADHANLQLGDADDEDFTIEAFVHVPDRALTADATWAVVAKSGAYELSVDFNEGEDLVNLDVWTGATPALVSFGTPVALTADWHHIAGSFDNQAGGAADRFTLYVDGTAQSSVPVIIEPGINSSTKPLLVGAGSASNPWEGWIDEVRISDTVRYPTTEQDDTYSVPDAAFANDANTRALWHFDDALCATSFTDSSGNDNALAAVGAAHVASLTTASVVAFTAADYTAAETDGIATVIVSRTGGTTSSGAVDYATSDGTAVDGSDYTGASGTLHFACDQESQTITVAIADDADVETTETVQFALAEPTYGMTLGVPATATLTIASEDYTRLSVQAVPTEVLEGGATTPLLRVTREGSTTAASTAHLTIDPASTATSGGDFLLSSSTVYFAPGETVVDVPVSLTDDDLPEANETLIVALANPSLLVEIGSPSQTMVTIGDDDSRAVVLFQSTSRTVAENTANPVLLTVTRANNTDHVASVQYDRVSGTALPGIDFTLSPGTLTFAAAQTSKTIPVTINNDQTREGPETVVIALSNEDPGTTLVQTTLTLTIAASDQDPDGQISSTQSSGYIGNNVYNSTGVNQTKTLTAQRGHARNFYVRVFNDGTRANTFTIKGSAATPAATVRYFSSTGADITTKLRSTAGLRISVAKGGYVLVRVRLALPATATVGTVKSATVTGSWTGDGIHKDVVKASVKVVR